MNGLLIALAGLPGTGKTTVARELVRVLATGAPAGRAALHLRIDTIEQILLETGAFGPGLGPVGYCVAHGVAEDNLRLGTVVISDCVNPLRITRDGWAAVAARAGVPILDVEIVCTDGAEHRRRVENRRTDIAGLVLPTWQQVVDRPYDAWDRPRLVIDSARQSAPGAAAVIAAAVHRV